MIVQVVSILVELSGIDDFSKMREQVQKKVPVLHKIKVHKSEVYPLAAMALNEGSQRGNRQVLENIFLKQLKVPKDKVCRLSSLSLFSLLTL